MDILAERDIKISKLKNIVTHLDTLLKSEKNDIEQYQIQNPYLVDAAKKCIDDKANTNKNNILKIEMLENIYNHLNELETNKKISKHDLSNIKKDKKNITRLLNSLYDEI